MAEIGADEIEQLGTRIDELTAENTALSEKAENADNALKNENAQLKNKVDELKAENKTLRASSENADSSSAENEALKSRLAEARTDTAEELLEKLRTDHENLVSKSSCYWLRLINCKALWIHTKKPLMNTQISVTQRSRT